MVTLREVIDRVYSVAGGRIPLNIRQELALLDEVNKLCGKCGNPRSMHRSDKDAHHSECTTDQYVVGPVECCAARKALDAIIRRVALVSPYYEMARSAVDLPCECDGLREDLAQADEDRQGSAAEIIRLRAELAAMTADRDQWTAEKDRLQQDLATAVFVVRNADKTEGDLAAALERLADMKENYSGAMSDCAEFERKLSAIGGCLPTTFYVGVTLDQRINRLVNNWQRAIEANAVLETDLAAANDYLRRISLAGLFTPHNISSGSPSDIGVGFNALAQVDRILAVLTATKKDLAAALEREKFAVDALRSVKLAPSTRCSTCQHSVFTARSTWCPECKGLDPDASKLKISAIVAAFDAREGKRREDALQGDVLRDNSKGDC